MKIRIYKQEKEDGLENDINNNFITCSYDLLPCEKFDFNIQKQEFPCKEVASINESSDLFYFSAIHASTGANKNDHYFLPEELWMAKDSVIHKRINYEHNENEIVGSDLMSYAADFDGNIIHSDTDINSIPDKFDIHTKGVIYATWQDKKRQEFIDKMISKIKNGELCVSMECYYKDWDYFLMDSEGNTEFVTRNRATSHMTKSLKRFGGKGTYNGKRIGMVLKNITFAGKGIVEKPANQRSIITEVQEDVKNIVAIDKIVDHDVYSKTEGNQMSQEDQNKIDELNKKVSEFTIANLDLNSKISDMQKTIDQLNKEKEDLVKAKQVEVEKLQASLQEVNLVVSEYKTKELVTARVEKVMEKLGLVKEKANEYVEKLKDQTDSQFETTIEFASEAVSVKKPEKVSDKPAPMLQDPKKISVLEFTKKAKASLEDAQPEESLNPSVLGEQPLNDGSKARNDIINFMTADKKKK